MNTDSENRFPPPGDNDSDTPATAPTADASDTSWHHFEERLLKVTQELGMRAWPRIARGLNSLPPGRAAHLIESSTPHQRSILWSLLNDDLEAEVTPLLSTEVRQDLLSKMDRDELQELAVRMDTDELVEVVSELPDRIASDVLSRLDADRAQRVSSLLAFEAGTAGSMITPEIPALLSDTSVYMALQYLGERPESIKGTDILPVTDRKNNYRGCVSISAMLGAKRSTPMRSLIDANLPSISPTASTPEAVARMDGTDWDGLAVVDEGGQLLGMVRRERIVEAALRAADEFARRQTGADEDTFAPLMESTRRRSIWLAANLLTAAAAAAVIGLFEQTLVQVVALAVLMPIVTSMGGVAATQTLAITVRALALNQLHQSNINWLLNREISVSALCGLALTLPALVLVVGWFGDTLLASLLAGAVLLNLVIGALAGVFIPVLMRRIKIDAAVSGAVIVTTITDVAGFAIFLGLGTIFYL